MVKRIIFAATILILSITTFSQSIPKLKFTGLKVISYDKNEINLKWNLNKLHINPVLIDNRQFVSISFEGCDYTDKIGLPEIPFKTFRIGVPENAVVQYSISNVQYETISNITPLPVGQPQKEISGITSLARKTNSNNYNFNPEEFIEFSGQEFFKDLPFVNGKYYPISYNHSSNVLRYIKSADIKITIQGGNQSNTNSVNNKYCRICITTIL